jgi:Asp-tRNA(Asn)/Glu-tRNA(Gln) amidotransferase A subunit family amidase
MPLVPPLLTELRDAEKLRPLELRMLRNTRPFNVLGWPTITLPSASLTDKLRLGLQLSGQPGSDLYLLEIARKVENCIKGLG